MKSGQLVVFGIAALAAGGAGYTATQLTSSDPLPIEQVSAQPQISLGEVLVATQDIPVGSEVGSFVRWQEWPTAAITQGYITRDAEPDALDSIGRSIARLGMMEGEPVRPDQTVGRGPKPYVCYFAKRQKSHCDTNFCRYISGRFHPSQ